MYEFLKGHYKYARFEGLNGDWCPDYSELVTRSTPKNLSDHRYSAVSVYEDKAGEGIFFGSNLKLLEGKVLQRVFRGEPEQHPQ